MDAYTAIFLIIFSIIGLLFSSLMLYLEWRRGYDITVIDVVVGLFTAFAWPICFPVYLISTYRNTLIFKGKKK